MALRGRNAEATSDISLFSVLPLTRDLSMNGLNMVAFAAWFVNVAAICNRLGGKVAAQVIKAQGNMFATRINA